MSLTRDLTRILTRDLTVSVPPFIRNLGADGSSDPEFANVLLLMNGDGENDASTNIVDRSNNGWVFTTANSVQIDTDIKKLGTGSIQFAGETGLSLYRAASADWHLARDADWTVEAFIYINTGATGSGFAIFSHWDWSNDNAGRMMVFYRSSGGALAAAFTAVGSGSATITTSNGALPDAETWYHVVVQNTAGVGAEMFIDGTRVYGPIGLGVAPQSPSANHDIAIGSVDQTSSVNLNGRIDSLRITKGVARYSDGYTVPTEPFPTS